MSGQTGPVGGHRTGEARQDEVRAIIEKYERESNIRLWTGRSRQLVRLGLALFILLTVAAALLPGPPVDIWLPVFLGLCILLGFAVYPHRRAARREGRVPWFDVVLMAAGAAAFFLLALRPEGEAARWELAAGLVGLISLGELCRRCVGLPLTCIAALFLVYAFLWTGDPAMVLDQVLFAEGAWDGGMGLPVRVCAQYIVGFILFGAILEKAGSSAFFIDLSSALAGASRGGPAKVAVLSSALCGMASGSSVGNTVATGSETIPMMKRSGCSGEFAGAVEAAASTGGQLVPPIMGAAAFLLADAAGVPYSDVVLRAVIPAMLYFAGIFIAVSIEAQKRRLPGLPKEEVPALWPLIRRRGVLLLPLVLLLVLIMTHLVPLAHAAALSALMGVAAWALNGEERLTLSRLVDALADGARTALAVAVSCGLAGVIVGVTSMTGLAERLTELAAQVFPEGAPALALALVVTMVCCTLLGTLVPTTANFCIMAALFVPGLIHLGAQALPAYFFLFYFGIVSDLTPPVAVAVSAGATIAQSDPLHTAGRATLLAITGFVVPYIFVFSPSMLLIDATLLDVVQLIVASLFGIFGVTAGLEGYFLLPMNWGLRMLSILGGISLIYPNATTNMTGFVLIIVVLSVQTLQNSRDPDSLSS